MYMFASCIWRVCLYPLFYPRLGEIPGVKASHHTLFPLVLFSSHHQSENLAKFEMCVEMMLKPHLG